MIEDFIENSFKTSLAVLTALRFRDPDTESHCMRVASLSSQIGARMGLSERLLGCAVSSAILHDVGKIGIPDSILLHDGPLDEHELNVIQGHCDIGQNIVKHLDIPTAEEVSLLVRWHHERLDGKGYPDGLTGDQIPLIARIISAADTYDALTSERSYRPRWSDDSAIKELDSEEESRFGRDVIDALKDVLKFDKPLFPALERAPESC